MERLPVHGMSCVACEAKVVSALSDIDGVFNVCAQHESDQVLFEITDPLAASMSRSILIKQVSDCIEALGYEIALPANSGIQSSSRTDPQRGAAQTARVKKSSYQGKGERSEAPKPNKDHGFVLDISGMTCASCVRSVERAIESNQDVHFVSVNFANNTASLSTSGKISQIIESVKAAGYGATLHEKIQSREKKADLKRRLAREVTRSLVALLAAAVLMYNDALGLVPASQVAWFGVSLLVLGILAIVGGRYYRSAWGAVRRGTASMDTLIALGTSAAWIYSTVTVLFPSLGAGVLVNEVQQNFFEAALFVIGFVHLGKSIEEYAKGNTSLALLDLLNLQPAVAQKVEGGVAQSIPVEQVNVGDQLCVRAGEAVPLDGRVIRGQSAIDEQMLSGETVPVVKQYGDPVTGGTVNIEGTLYIEVTDTGDNTVLSRMVEAVQRAQNSKPPIAQLADQIAAIFVPVVIVIAVVAACFWWWLVPDFRLGFSVFMTVLIVACPCALGLAIPLSVVVGMGRAASLGVVIRNSDALQRASQVDTVIVDKTGTLTQGKPQVVSVVLNDYISADQFASIALSLETNSMHPLAFAIARHFDDAPLFELVNEQIVPGMGITAEHNTRHCILGNEGFLLKHGYDLSDIELKRETMVQVSGSRVYVGYDGQLLGVIVLQDSIRESTSLALAELRAQSIDIVLLSGDNNAAVKQIADQLRIDQASGEMSPQMKQAFIAERQAAGAKVAMVGDGINDALALTQADVGFAMGTGSDIALESADITLIRNDLAAVPQALNLSRKVMRNIHQNLFAAFVYNIALIPIAAGVLFPMTGSLLNPGLAGLAMALSSLSVVANAGRLRLMA